MTSMVSPVATGIHPRAQINIQNGLLSGRGVSCIRPPDIVEPISNVVRDAPRCRFAFRPHLGPR